MKRIIRLTVNGREREDAIGDNTLLIDYLRQTAAATSVKQGCDGGECGACTVLIDGLPRYACISLAVEAEDTEIVTLEGLMEGEQLGAVQQAFLEHDAFQCGYCTPGQIMSAEGMLRSNPSPNPGAIRREMSGNLCRCGAYTHIFKAVRHAAELKQGK